MPLTLNGSTGVLDGLMVSSANLTSDAVYLTAPAGAIAFVCQSTAPTGWIKANGAAISRTAYSALFTAIGTTFGAGNGSTTFNLPDLRGEFPRGWDDSRGVDSGRGLGSAQTDALQNITGSINEFYGGANVGGGGGAFASASSTNGAVGSNLSVTKASGYTFDASRVVRTASETRPRNTALLAIIKF